jgi:hypothetical protein
MAPRRSNKKPNKKPLPKPEIVGGESAGDKIEELLFQIKQEEKAEARQQEPQTPQRQRTPRKSRTPRRITKTGLSLGNNKSNNCCNCCDDMLGMLNIINESVSRVLNALKAESLLDKKKTDGIRKNQEDQERKEKENL